MSIKWQDSSKPTEAMELGFMLDDMRTFDRVRRDHVGSLAASLIGLTLEQVESRLEELDGGYHAYAFTATSNKRSFRVSKNDTRGWDGVSFTISEEGVVLEARAY
jgi:hypothetical protein